MVSFIPRERTTANDSTERQTDPKGGLEVVAKRKIPSLSDIESWSSSLSTIMAELSCSLDTCTIPTDNFHS
jgi:hypothetical protein